MQTIIKLSLFCIPLFTIYKLLISCGNVCQRALSQRKAWQDTHKLCIYQCLTTHTSSIQGKFLMCCTVAVAFGRVSEEFIFHPILYTTMLNFASYKMKAGKHMPFWSPFLNGSNVIGTTGRVTTLCVKL